MFIAFDKLRTSLQDFDDLGDLPVECCITDY